MRTEKIMENPTDIPSIFMNNKSIEIMSGLRLENIKSNKTRKVNMMK